MEGLEAHAEGDGDGGGDFDLVDGGAGGLGDGEADGVELLLDGGVAHGFAVHTGAALDEVVGGDEVFAEVFEVGFVVAACDSAACDSTFGWSGWLGFKL